MEADAPFRALGRDFFDRPTIEVARDLVGVWLIRESEEGLAGGPIVETEGYSGPDDLASHARAGLTKRTAPMFGEVGRAYVYLVYGMHECLNVVAHHGATAGAVLLRAIEPRIGVELMRARRGRTREPDARLAAGPGRLCQALAVTRDLNGHDLTTRQRLWLAQPPHGEPLGEIVAGKRIGVDYAGAEWSGRQWRFWLADSPSVSALAAR